MDVNCILSLFKAAQLDVMLTCFSLNALETEQFTQPPMTPSCQMENISPDCPQLCWYQENTFEGHDNNDKLN